jgi:hypothetical protein
MILLAKERPSFYFLKKKSTGWIIKKIDFGFKVFEKSGKDGHGLRHEDACFILCRSLCNGR